MRPHPQHRGGIVNLKGIRAVVTGGSSGIGLHVAQALADEGAHVVVTGRNPGRLAEAATTRDGIEAKVCDVTDDEAIVALREAVIAGGGCDLLVNNAGVMHTFDVRENFPLEKQLLEVDIDVNGPVRMVHHFLPHLLSRPSTIVNVSSGLAFVPFAAAPVYSATKAFVHAWTQGLRAQLGGTSVRVVELMPPVVDTPMVEELDGAFSRMPPTELASAFLKGLRNGTDEIVPGQSSQLRFMRRLAPGFLFRQLNRQFVS